MFQKVLFDLVCNRKHFHPFRYIKLYLRYREFIQNGLQNPINIFFLYLFTIYGHCFNSICIFQFFCLLLSLLAMWFF